MRDPDLETRAINTIRFLAADAIQVRLQKVEAEAHRRRRVDGVAALLHDAKARSAGQVVAGSDDASLAHDDRSSGECRHSTSLLIRDAQPKITYHASRIIQLPLRLVEHIIFVWTRPPPPGSSP